MKALFKALWFDRTPNDLWRLLACDALVVLFALSLAGCGGPEPSRLLLPACPSLPEYTKGQQVQAADELTAMPDGGIVKGLFMPDYGRMRDAVRACRQAQETKK